MANNRRKGTSSLGFVSGGTLNVSKVDSSINEDDETPENKEILEDSDVELNSDEDFISNIINYDDYIVVDDEEEDYEGNEEYNREIMSKQVQFQNKRSRRYSRYESREKEESEMGYNEDNIQKMYGKGLNMLKKMGYKGGALGRDGKGLVKPLLFTTNKTKDNVTYKIERSETYETTESGERVGKEMNWLTQLENIYKELVDKNETIKKNKRELETNNVKLGAEIKQIKEQIRKKAKKLETIKLIKPTIVYNYKEYILLLDETNLQGIVVKKLLVLLNSLNQLKVNNKLYKTAIKLTFKKVFIPEYYNNIEDYRKVFESLPTINKYYRNKYNSEYDEDEKGYMKKVYNYYIINELIKYYRDEWNIMNIDEGINIYQKICEYLSECYSNENKYEDEKYINNEFNDEYSGKYGGREEVEENKLLTSNRKENDNGLSRLLRTILNKLRSYMERSKLKSLYNSHIVMFAWLQYLNDQQIEGLANKYMEELFKREESLIPSYEVEYQQKSANSGSDGGSKVKIYENIQSNWGKLMADKEVFGDKVYNKLYTQLNSMNYNYYDENREKLKELVNNVVEWVVILGNDGVVRLISSTLMHKFGRSVREKVANLSERYMEMKEDGRSDDDEEEEEGVVESDQLNVKRKKLIQLMEDIEESYMYFKSILPDYVNSNRDVQVNHYKVILKSMESFMNLIEASKSK
ncbi:uncharacterized protein TOT_010000627 [Theileria orientalis strain Shintoku]|uniref:G-patch domain-containing protein n=1 Tax=Theileria orientalis strain Shintoku TaxID=869250 RepID=J4C2R8_THEOR|nr:uncharacterized protein TOT_010000627 [Theileria orientalis strain Shintoku]BAM39166.1 uncharacterized protein TOT_010000627 [Theileria orientalis strain Shintoku]|eukprot:XP_009689467.1 uncharacterized protein TOT_010000627 [Theileria orientalis strain Shintoku]